MSNDNNIDDMMTEALQESYGLKHINHCIDYLKQNGFKHAIVIAAENVDVAFPGDHYGEPKALETMANAFLINLSRNEENNE